MTKRLLMIGAAVLTLGAAAVAVADDPPRPHNAPRAEGHRPFGAIDANRDGFVSRDEVRAQTERVFDEMDTNDDGKLDSSDRGRMERRIVEKRIVRKGDGKDAKTEEHIEEDIIIEHGGPGDGERRVIVRKHGDGPRHGGRGGHHMRGGMPFMMLMHSDEADTNGDGALSKQEMVTQHLRFFDAGDANGDGKIKFDPPEPPRPPEPPEPPAPPAPPKR